MRLTAFVLAALVVSGPVAAEWKEFNSVSEGFGVVFPADPDVEEVAMFEVVPSKMVWPGNATGDRVLRCSIAWPRTLYIRDG